jgi:hypothetical protein
VSSGWGEPGGVGEDERLPGSVDLGNGNRLVFNATAFKKLLHSPAAVNAVTQRASEICAAANAMVALDARTIERLGDGQPAYKVTVQNNPDTTRARARVLPAGILGAVDDAHNATLLKAVDAHPSDGSG